ncbi:glyoxalase [Solihabitans fulvus]|uniref:Glyoxalase n=1 Tax=Solihabitans fulvus TaxID=1892852 RepID=A0A5B2WIH8_9PSEU|nr:VOC family protein [Solihabitans fulvus]KAA2250718.1 glyoxalase [Solihabitans fulvus]
MNDFVPPPQVWPTLRARDARALIRFLVDVVGLEDTAVYGEGAVVQHAELTWPEGGGVMLGSERPDAGMSTQSGTFGAYVVTDEPDALYARVTAAGAQIAAEPSSTDYDSRNFTLRDPEGNHWTFGTYRGAPRKPREGVGD